MTVYSLSVVCQLRDGFIHDSNAEAPATVHVACVVQTAVSYHYAISLNRVWTSPTLMTVERLLTVAVIENAT